MYTVRKLLMVGNQRWGRWERNSVSIETGSNRRNLVTWLENLIVLNAFLFRFLLAIFPMHISNFIQLLHFFYTRFFFLYFLSFRHFSFFISLSLAFFPFPFFTLFSLTLPLFLFPLYFLCAFFFFLIQEYPPPHTKKKL